MKKLFTISFVYLIAALAGGVFYREFTKAFAFTGTTTLAFIHLHLFVLGFLVMMLLAVAQSSHDLIGQKHFKSFFTFYNIGLVGMVCTLVWRGVLQTMEVTISFGVNGAISGIAGVFHICLAIGLVLGFLMVRDTFMQNGSRTDVPTKR